MTSMRTITRLAMVAFLAAGVSSCASLKPKEPVPTASIRVVNRFGLPIEGIEVDVSREKKRRKMLEIPFEKIASATSNADGRVKFQNLLEDDGVGTTSRDGRFHGVVQLEADTAEYELRLNQHGGIGVEYTRGITESGYFDSGSKAAKTLVKILDHYVATNSREFLSLNWYVSRQIVSRDEADRILSLSPFMIHGDRSINFLWGDHRLRIENYDSPLQWTAPRTKDD